MTKLISEPDFPNSSYPPHINPSPESEPGPLQIRIDDGFKKLLAKQKSSIALTVGPDGLLIIGITKQGQLHIEHRFIANAFAIAVDGGRLAVSAQHSITVYNRSTKMAGTHPTRPDVYDAYYSPLVTFHTGDCLVHDMVASPRGLVVANTRFSTVCLIDGLSNINPIWQPSFISVPAPEDRCHLNGLAIDHERLRYVTTFGPFDKAGGWRKLDDFHGLLIDVAQDRNLVEGLSLPHSPRLFGKRLFVCESGYGDVLEIDPGNGAKRRIARLPGLTRGLAEHEGVFYVGLSSGRPSSNVWKLPLMAFNDSLTAGVAAIDPDTGELLGRATILNPGREVLDVKVIPGVHCAGMADPNDPNEYQLIEGPPGGYWLQSAQGKYVKP